MKQVPFRCLLALLCPILSWPQELPTVRLVSSAFVGEPAPAPLLVTQPNVMRIATDRAGNRFTTLGDAVRKIAQDHRIVWTSRFRGKRLTGLALDAAGNAWVAGDDGLPIPEDRTGFLTQLDAAGNVTRTIVVEGSPAGLAIDPLGDLHVAGIASRNFRATSGTWKSAIGAARCSDRYGTVYYACQDAFAMKLSADGSRVIFATFVGGTRGETAWDVAAGPDGSTYVVGETTSDDFPVTAGAAQSRFGGLVTLGPFEYGDGFAARISPDGRRAMWSSYLGGAAADRIYAAAVEPGSGNLVVAGRTEDALVMPSSLGDAMLARFDPAGRLLNETRWGEPGLLEFATSIAAAPGGRVFANIFGAGVLELDPRMFEPVRRGTQRVSAGWAAIAAGNRGASGLVEAVMTGGEAKSNVFAVEPGQPASGAQYIAGYDFDQPSRPAVTGIVNAATFTQGRRNGGAAISVAPNQIISIFGEKLAAPARVMLGDRALQVIYADEHQINAVVPDGIAQGTAPITVAIGGGATQLGPWQAEIARVASGLFTVPSDAPFTINLRIAAAVNEDGSVNAWTQPAKAGSIVALYTTGLGALTNETPLRRLREHIEAYGPSGGLEILYAGEAPGFVGVQQVNVRIPRQPISSRPFAMLIKLTFNFGSSDDDSTQDNVALFVREVAPSLPPVLDLPWSQRFPYAQEENPPPSRLQRRIDSCCCYRLCPSGSFSLSR